MVAGTGRYTIDSGSFSIQRNEVKFRYRVRDPGLASNPCPDYGDIYTLFPFGQDDNASQPRHIVQIYDAEADALTGPQIIHLQSNAIFDYGGFGSYWQANLGGTILHWLSGPYTLYDDTNAIGYIQIYSSSLDLTCPGAWTLNPYPPLPDSPADQAYFYTANPGYSGPYGCDGKLFIEFQVEPFSGTPGAPDKNFVYMRDMDDYTTPWTLVHAENLYPSQASGGTTYVGYDLRAARRLPGGRIVLVLIGGAKFPTGAVQNFTLTSDNGGASWTKTDLTDIGFSSTQASTNGEPIVGSSLVIPAASAGFSIAHFLKSTDGQSWGTPLLATRSGGSLRQIVNPNNLSNGLIAGNAAGTFFVGGIFDPSGGSVIGGNTYRYGSAYGTIAGNDFVGIGPIYDSTGTTFLTARGAIYDEERDVWWIAASNYAFKSGTPSLVEHYLLKMSPSFAELARIPLPTYTRSGGTQANYPQSVGKFPPQASRQP